MSFWIDTTVSHEYPRVAQDISTDVLVIGAGISGLTTAYNLINKGFKVTIIDDGYIGSGETGRTTAHLSYALDDRYFDLIKTFGIKKTKLIGHSHKDAIDTIEQIVQKENIECEFKRLDGYLFLHPTDSIASLRKEARSLQRLKLPCERTEEIPGIDQKGPAIRFPNQGQFHSMKYLQGLAKAIADKGGDIYIKSKGEDISSQGAKANGYTINARYIVVATGAPVSERLLVIHKLGSYRTYAIGATIKKNDHQDYLRWDTGEKERTAQPYHYARMVDYDATHNLLIVGGEDHITGQAENEHLPEQERYAKLISWAKKKFPDMEEVVYTRSGQIQEPVDGIAYIGKSPLEENIYIITGDSGNGMTYGTMAGSLLSDEILGKYNELSSIYSPTRSPLSVPKEYATHVLNMAKQYKDWFTSGDKDSYNNIKKNSGVIIRHGLHKRAVYRDEKGKLKIFSAVCPHLGGIVRRNDDEKSFDCPCHGSRFDIEGTCINGPAAGGLEVIEEE